MRSCKIFENTNISVMLNWNFVVGSIPEIFILKLFLKTDLYV